jgi:hypothetical protein
MSYEVDTALVNTYRSNIEIQFQQKGSRLRPYVREEPQNAEFDFYDRIGPTEAVEVQGRHTDTPLVSTPHDRRRVALRDFDWADLVDRKDKLRMLADPTSSYTLNAVYALGRKMDDIIIEAAFDTAYTGKTGATSVTFANDNGETIASTYVESGSATASNLTIGKLRRARKLLQENEAEEDEELIAVVTSSQLQALLRTTEVTSSDYNSVKALVNGEVDTFMGWNFVRTERLAKSGDIRDCIFYCKSAMILGVADDIMVDVGPRRDKRNSTQIYVSASFGSVRSWGEKVIKVQCDESVV